MKRLVAFAFLILFFAPLAQAYDVCPNDGEWKTGCSDLKSFDLRNYGSKSRNYRLKGLPHPPEEIRKLNPDLESDTRYLAALAGAILGLMQTLPADIAEWTEHDESAFEVWEKHVHNLPHWDKDTWVWNYVAHPIAGASYYRVCRDKKISFGQCYLYSFVVSALLWEYGWEATIERPSIQDLIITPTAGALIGEIMTVLAKEIKKNGGKVLGSRALGQAILKMLNPMGSLIEGLRAVVDPVGEKLNAKTFFYYGRGGRYRPIIEREWLHPEVYRIEMGVRIKLKPGWEQRLLRLF